MVLNILNDTSFKSIKIIHNNKELVLNRGQSGQLENSSGNNFNFDVLVNEKNKVMINFLFAAIDGLLGDDHIINVINCNASLELTLSEDNSTVILSDLCARTKDNDYIYQSVYPTGDNVTVKSNTYSLTDTKKQEKKCKFYYNIITSWILPIVIILACALLAGETVGIISFAVISLFLLLMFALPSWKKSSKVKVFYSKESAEKFLHEEIEKASSKSNNGQNTDYPDDIIGKATYKILDKLFKKDK